LVLTDERRAGACGIPVLIKSEGATDPLTYRPSDPLEFANHVMPAAYWAKLLGELKREPKDREFIAEFLGLWPQGPQLSVAGEKRDFMNADDLGRTEIIGAPKDAGPSAGDAMAA